MSNPLKPPATSTPTQAEIDAVKTKQAAANRSALQSLHRDDQTHYRQYVEESRTCANWFATYSRY